MEENNEIFGTDIENKWAQEYNELVRTKLKGKLEDFLQTVDVKKKDIKTRIENIQGLYNEMFKIQYEISRINPETLLNDGCSETPIYAWAINDQAKSWLSRLSSTLNILTIKASEINEKAALSRDIFIASFSILFSILFWYLTSMYSDKKSNLDLNNRTIEFKKYQDSITAKLRQEYILKFDTIKIQLQQQSKFDSIYKTKMDTFIMHLRKSKNSIQTEIHN